MAHEPFRYEPTCSVTGCDRPARYKVAALWSNGNVSELKNYGLACEAHRESQVDRARRSRQGVHLADGETLGDLGVYEFVPGALDAELRRITDEDQ